MYDKSLLGREQYSNANNLNARIYMNSKFSTNKYPWPMWMFDQLEKRENLKILELGCGTGLLWQINGTRIPASWDVTLSDYSKGMVVAAEKNLESVNMIFSFVVVNAEDINLPEKTVDLVIVNNMLYHLLNKEKAFSGIKSVLKGSGTFYATTAGAANLLELKQLIRDYKPTILKKLSPVR